MAQIKVHPIQQDFTVVKGAVKCGLCSVLSVPHKSTTPPRVTHLVHLVRHHLDEVNRTFTPEGRGEQVPTDVTE